MLCGCGDDANSDPEGGRALLARIREENYRAWQRAPGYDVRRPSRAAHGNAVDIYVNGVVASALAGPALNAWPVGSIVAKDGFRSDQHILTALMEKRSDGWYWTELDGAGEPQASGHPSSCIDCHASGSDFVRAFSLPR